ncbi:hypothetical protein DU484_15135 [Haloplanus rubicundus]|uniref:RCK N-terminal domain-containing protein n=1 Tax=Haloplanus rubicundus TaxID=1547898 RepID=A0A345EFV5_9EURY|nr:hypothetical protein DU484_15135 [Haloplanus rubicundus]
MRSTSSNTALRSTSSNTALRSTNASSTPTSLASTGTRDAGIDRADTLVAAIDDSNVNVQIALLATQLAPDLTVIVRVGDETYESVARHAGADDVMIPEVSGGERVSEQW